MARWLPVSSERGGGEEGREARTFLLHFPPMPTAFLVPRHTPLPSPPPDFDYITTLRAAATRAAAVRSLRSSRSESFLTLDLVGHLFDSGIINTILDLIEDQAASARILDFKVGKDRLTPTEMRLQIFSPPPGRPVSPRAGGAVAAAPPAPAPSMASLITDIRALAASMGIALAIDAEDS